MKPETALNLVQRYSFLTRAIKSCKTEIGDHLEKCSGLKGFRQEKDVIDGYEFRSDRAQQDEETHLKGWYTPEIEHYEYGGGGERVYLEVGDEQREECPHCYAAHQAIQQRKAHRRSLAGVKAAMTKGGSK